MEPMSTYFELTPVAPGTHHCRTFIGGTPSLTAGTAWPTCKFCRERLVHFLEIELPATSELPLLAEARLQIFACRQHDDIAGTIYSDYRLFQSASLSKALPKNYWQLNDGHYLIRLLPNASVGGTQREERLVVRHLDVACHSENNDSPSNTFKLFGDPAWVQDPEVHVCSCGGAMRLILQIPDGFGFDMAVNAPEQPNSFSSKQYCLFLGNQLYLLACERLCNPLALWPVLQN